MTDKWQKAEAIAMIAIAITAVSGFLGQYITLIPTVEKTSQQLSEIIPTVEKTSQQLSELQNKTTKIEEKQEDLIKNFTSIQELQKGIAIIDGPRVVNPNQPATYSAERSVIPDGKIIRFEWLIDEKIDYLGPKITHVCTEPGEHFIRLTVFSEDGRSTWIEMNLFVQEPLEP